MAAICDFRNAKWAFLPKFGVVNFLWDMGAGMITNSAKYKEACNTRVKKAL